jgi:putative transcriptional regulator
VPVKRVRLEELLKDKNRKEVADSLGITVQMLNAIVRGDRNPSLTLAKKIANYFGLTIDEVFYGENGNESFHDADEQLEGEGKNHETDGTA